ncbi:cytochrome c biogenesis protein CcsA [bacterium]|nr:cytochrome c biogenesis protein CcsA [bacterium]
MKTVNKFVNRIFSTSAAGLYMLIFAVTIGAATFIENDFGTSSAQKVIYTTRWFELLLLLFGISILVNIFRFKLIKQQKWATFAFHSSIIIILIGAGVTRYFGSEGMMHIRENSASNSFLSAETYLLFEGTYGGKKYQFNEPVLFATLGNNSIKKSYMLGGQEIGVESSDFLPNPTEVMKEDDNGIPTVKIVIGSANGRQEYYVQKGNRSRIRGTIFNFSATEDPLAFNIKYENKKLLFNAPTPFFQMQMATQKKDTLSPGQYHPLLLRSLYSSGQQSFVFGEFSPKAKVTLSSSDQKMASNSMGGIKIKVTNGTLTEEQYVFGGKGLTGRPRVFNVGDIRFAVSYGSKTVTLPFDIYLKDFILDKYPGTNSASSYASEVTLTDSRTGLERDQRIFMNNILDYNGYRFFQSSFDQDELGTYLSVNYDWWGTWISYIGYIILTLGMLLTLLSKKSRFRQLAKTLTKSQISKKTASAASLLLLIFFFHPAVAKIQVADQLKAPSVEHAANFGRLVMQDHRGRMKPMNTYSSEILRKLSRKESLYDLTPEQIILGMATFPKDWYGVPLIKVGKHEKTMKILPVPTQGNLISYSDFFDPDGTYKLREHVRAAYNTPKKDRGVFEKEMMKLDEKVNICSMVFSGSFMKVFPVVNDPNNTWTSPVDRNHTQSDKEPPLSQKFYRTYITTVRTAIDENTWELANRQIDELNQYQIKYGGEVMPSLQKRSAEILLNSLDVFSRLSKYYGLLGLLFLGLLFTSVFKPEFNVATPSKVAYGLFVVAFLFHLVGLGLRWYVSGRAPWSNGYESMIYIGFTTVLAGVIFGRKSQGSLAATCILASTILMVAGLSWMDPEITPLVPVLKSYWLTIHVSLEAGSYGFLMLGAIIGVINLVLMIFRNQKNALNINRIIKEMSQISEMTLIGGLFMVSIGTYLGGVWANESWGRYWGWDAKETWALVTILVYAFVLHMRFIPGLRGHYAFNVGSLFGWASVIMTYFGVNYYLSGLHSYAAGDPVPIPSFVYYAVGVLTAISLAAFWRNKQFEKGKIS